MTNGHAFHTTLAQGRWQTFSLMEQMGNIGSEVGRAMRAQGKDDNTFHSAVGRALELFDLTLADPRHSKRLKEIARAREVFCAATLGDGVYHTTLADLDRYFFQFAFAARNRG